MKARLFEFLFSLRETVRQWKMPFSSKRASDMADKVNATIANPSSQRKLVLIIVCIALLLDNMLYMVIVPIIPTYLRQIHAFGSNSDDSEATANVTMFAEAAATAAAAAAATATAATTGARVEATGNASAMARTAAFGLDVNGTMMRSASLYGTAYHRRGDEDVNVGLLFATKAIFQLLVNPFTGTLMDRIGYDVPMMVGLSIIFASTTMFAFGASYGVLFVARSLQGLGSAFADTSGLAMIADRFTEPTSRTRALGLALAFISFGSLVAPPFGGALYDFIGKEAPFLALAAIALFDGCLMMLVMGPVRREKAAAAAKLRESGSPAAKPPPKGTPIYRLIVDPYIAICAGSLVMANVSLAFLEPTIALWMRDTMHAPEWQMGLIWLPAFPPHVLGVFVTVKLAERYPHKQWLMAAIGLAMEGLSCMIVPFCGSFELLMLPLSFLCFGIALVDTAILPMMGHLVDVRHVSVYGSVYAIADISYSLAYAAGPIAAGQIVHAIGFTWLNVCICASNVLYAPLLAFNRHAYKYVPFRNESPLDSAGGGALGDGLPDHKLYTSYSGQKDGDDDEERQPLRQRQQQQQPGEPALRLELQSEAASKAAELRSSGRPASRAGAGSTYDEENDYDDDEEQEDEEEEEEQANDEEIEEDDEEQHQQYEQDDGDRSASRLSQGQPAAYRNGEQGAGYRSRSAR